MFNHRFYSSYRSFIAPTDLNNRLTSIDENVSSLVSFYHTPAIGINIGHSDVHLVLLELYPQNVDQSTVTFQRYLLSLMIDNEHKDWSIVNVELQTQSEQQGNFRLFTLTKEQFDLLLIRLQSFIRYNAHLASSFVLNIALTGEQTHDYESKISSYLSKINLNFDIIPHRAESYMIGLQFFIGKHDRHCSIDDSNNNNDDEFIELSTTKHKFQQYPYVLLHAALTSTFVYVVHSVNKYSIITSNNLCYQTSCNLIKLLQPDFIGKHEPTTYVVESRSTCR
jgi:hypothetical protein